SICSGGGQISYCPRYVPLSVTPEERLMPFFPISVVDILNNHDAPPALVSHRLIFLSLSHTWTCGRTLIPVSSLFRRILQHFRSVATPRCVEPTLLQQCP